MNLEHGLCEPGDRRTELSRAKKCVVYYPAGILKVMQQTVLRVFNRYLLSAYRVPGAVNAKDTNLCHQGAHFLILGRIR